MNALSTCTALLLLLSAQLLVVLLPVQVACEGHTRKRVLLQGPESSHDENNQEQAVAAAAAAPSSPGPCPTSLKTNCMSCHLQGKAWTCDTCNPGRRLVTSAPGMARCVACKRGGYSKGGKSTSCTPCAAGSWAGGIASKCKKCPGGFTTSTVGCWTPANCTVLVPNSGGTNPFLTPPMLKTMPDSGATYGPSAYQYELSSNTRLINPSISITDCTGTSLTVSVAANVDLSTSLLPGSIITGVPGGIAAVQRPIYAEDLPCTAILRKVLSVTRLSSTLFRVDTGEAEAFSAFNELSFTARDLYRTGPGTNSSRRVFATPIIRHRTASPAAEDVSNAIAAGVVPAGVFGDWGKKTFTIWPEDDPENSAFKLQVETDIDFDPGDVDFDFDLDPVKFQADFGGKLTAGVTLKAIVQLDRSLFKGDKEIATSPTLWDKTIWIQIAYVPVPVAKVGLRAALAGGWAITAGLPETFEAALGFQLETDIKLGAKYTRSNGFELIHDFPNPEPQLVKSFSKLPCTVRADVWVTPRLEFGFAAYNPIKADAFDDDWFGICRASAGVQVTLGSKVSLSGNDPAFCNTCENLAVPKAQLEVTPSLAAALELRATGHIRRIIELFTNTVSLQKSIPIATFDTSKFCLPVPTLIPALMSDCCSKPSGVVDPASHAGSYLGCFNEPSGTADKLYSRVMVPLGQLVPEAGAAAKGMTVEGCAGLAADHGYLYAAVQNGNLCFGGNNISMYSVPGVCTTPCAGDTSQVCGGNMASSIYAVKPSPTAWTCQLLHSSLSPGWATPVRLNAYAEVECMADDGKTCYWKNVDGSPGELQNCKDLAAHGWEGHPTVPSQCGEGGYNTPDHFCAISKYRLTPWTCVYYPWNGWTTIQRINNAGIIECFSLDRENCFWWGPGLNRADMVATEVARRACVKYLKQDLLLEPEVKPFVCTTDPNAFICKINSQILTSTSAAHAVESIDHAIWRGCWYDTADRAVPVLREFQTCIHTGGQPYCYNEPITAMKCILEAKRLGYRFAAVQAGYQCFIGNDEVMATKYGLAYDPNSELSTKYESLGCNRPCNGWSGEFNDTYTCGGTWANSIYELDATFPAAASALESPPAESTASLAMAAAAGFVTPSNARMVTAGDDVVRAWIEANDRAAAARVVHKVASPAEVWAAGPTDALP